MAWRAANRLGGAILLLRHADTREAMARCAMDNLLAALESERPVSLVSSEALKG